MYTYERNTCRIVLIAVIVMILMALMGTTLASAKQSHPPKDDHKVVVPHQNDKQDDKPMNVDCHSRHARDAGVSCDEKKTDAQSRPPAQTQSTTATDKPAKIHSVTSPGDPKIYFPIIMKP